MKVSFQGKRVFYKSSQMFNFAVVMGNSFLFESGIYPFCSNVESKTTLIYKNLNHLNATLGRCFPL